MPMPFSMRTAIRDVLARTIAEPLLVPGVNVLPIARLALSEELVGQIDGAVRDALLQQGCPHGCGGVSCPYTRRIKENAS